MKLLETYQKLVAFAIDRNRTSLISLAVLSAANIMAVFSFFTDEIHTFQQYSEIIYGFSTALSSITVLIAVLYKRAKIFQFIDAMQTEVEKRKMKLSAKCKHILKRKHLFHLRFEESQIQSNVQ